MLNMPVDNGDNGLMGATKTMMDKMNKMKMSGDFDIDYANMMVEHHQGAIDMSEIEVAKGTDAKMKRMAQNIITKQSEDISKLEEIIRNGKASGMKHGEGAMEKSMGDMKTKITGMQMSGSTDKIFVNMMIAHHEGSVNMSKDEVTHGMNAELKQMAKKGISHETKEIEEFKSWLSANQ